MKPPYQNRDLLARMFIDRGMTADEIAEKCDTSPETIRKWLRQHRLTVRGASAQSSGDDYNPDWSKLKES